MSSHTEEVDKCPICLNSLTESDVYTTGCRHSFHKKCFDELTNKGFKTCPVCRANVALAEVIPNYNDVVNEIRDDSHAERAEERRLINLALAIINRDNTVSDRKLAIILHAAKGSPQFSIDDLLKMFDDDRLYAIRRVASPDVSPVASSVASSAARGYERPIARSVARSVTRTVTRTVTKRDSKRDPKRDSKRDPKRDSKRDPKRVINIAKRFNETHNINNSGGKKAKKKGQRTHRRKKNTSQSL